MDKERKLAAIEAILFSMGDSVSIEKLAEALETDKKEIKKLIAELQTKYSQPDHGLQIVELDGAYQMSTKADFYDELIKVVKQQRSYSLTDVMMETLSIIAYKQPITKVEIEKIRGVSCDHAVSRLVEFGLVRELGRLDAPGRPLLFGTTEEFLRCFGVRSVDQLPSVDAEALEQFKKQAEEEIYAPTEVEV